MTVVEPRLTLERRLLQEYPLVIACDEVGRGALAGPVAVGASAFPCVFPVPCRWWLGIPPLQPR